MREGPPDYTNETLKPANDNEDQDTLDELYKEKIKNLIGQLVQEGYPRDVLTTAAEVLGSGGGVEKFQEKLDEMPRLQGVNFNKEKLFDALDSLFSDAQAQVRGKPEDEYTSGLITEVKSTLEGLKGTYTAEVHTLSKEQPLNPTQQAAADDRLLQQEGQKRFEGIGLFNEVIGTIGASVNPEPYLTIAASYAIAGKSVAEYLQRLADEGRSENPTDHNSNIDEIHLYENVVDLFREVQANTKSSTSKDLTPLEETIRIFVLKLNSRVRS